MVPFVIIRKISMYLFFINSWMCVNFINTVAHVKFGWDAQLLSSSADGP
jgi:hypothetical protein